MKKLYFAHSRQDYGTEREKDMLKTILHNFWGTEIINPGAPEFVRKMEVIVDKMQSPNAYMKPFFEIINDCDMLVFMSLENKKMGVGTYLEIRHAEACEMPIYIWDGMRFSTNYRLDECHTHAGKRDYKDNWAIVTIGKGELQLSSTIIKGELQQNRGKSDVKQ